MADSPIADPISNAVADFVGSLKSLSKAEWNEAEEILGDRNDAIQGAVRRASDVILASADRARAFADSLASATKSVSVKNFPEETADLLVKTVLLAIFTGNTISERDYNTLVEPMRLAWANIPTWAALQHSG